MHKLCLFLMTAIRKRIANDKFGLMCRKSKPYKKRGNADAPPYSILASI